METNGYSDALISAAKNGHFDVFTSIMDVYTCNNFRSLCRELFILANGEYTYVCEILVTYFFKNYRDKLVDFVELSLIHHQETILTNVIEKCDMEALQDHEIEKLLITAFIYPDVDVIKKIINIYPNTSFNNSNAFRYACYSGSIDNIKYLVDNYPDNYVSHFDFSMYDICKCTSFEVVEYLFENFPEISKIKFDDDFKYKFFKMLIRKNYFNMFRLFNDTFNILDTEIFNTILYYDNLDIFIYAFDMHDNYIKCVFNDACEYDAIIIAKYLKSIYHNLVYDNPYLRRKDAYDIKEWIYAGYPIEKSQTKSARK